MAIRAFIFVLLTCQSIVSAAPSLAQMPRVGLLRVDSPPRKPVDEFRRALRELGYVEGQNLALEIRWAESKLPRLPELAAELVRLNVDVIVTHGPQGIGAARAATRSIPIVMGRIDDVDVHGFVKTLARPGGNITGLSFQTGELVGKCLELLKEILPKVSNVAALWDATGNAKQLKAVEAAGNSLGVKIDVVKIRSAGDLDRALETAAMGRAQGLLILGSPFLTFNATRLAQMTVKHRLPAIYTNTNFAGAGGLMAYGPSDSDPNWGWKRAAVFVDKILKGAKPADLPVEQPTKFRAGDQSQDGEADRPHNSTQCLSQSRPGDPMSRQSKIENPKSTIVWIPPHVLARADQVIR